jgi:hypothetical protein
MKKCLLFILLFITVMLNAEWTIVQTFPIPEGASGLAFDGTYLYCGIYGANGDEVYQIDPSDGTYQLQFSIASIGDSFGMTYDGTNLWITDHVTSPSIPATAIELDINSGAILSQFDLPAHYMSGIAYDNGDFWVAAYYDPDGQIYKVDNTGAVIQQFPAPDNQPWDLCLENDNLWMADYWGDALYKIDPVTGTLLETNASEGVDPAGIVWDGQYLWYCDNGAGGFDYLYKVDLAGMGTVEGMVSLVGGSGNIENCIINIGGFTVTPDASGYYSITIASGTYTMTITLEGYQTLVIEDIVIVEGQTTAVDITLIYLFPPQNLSYTIEEIDVILEWDAPQTTRDVVSYKVYRDEEEIADVTELTFTDEDLTPAIYEYYVTAIYTDGQESESSNTATIEITSSGNNIIPLITKLHGNYPNPFNPSTTIRFDLAKDSDVTLQIFNLKGQLVKTLVQEKISIGVHTVEWNGDDNADRSVASGVYLYKLQADTHLSVKKCILLK